MQYLFLCASGAPNPRAAHSSYATAYFTYRDAHGEVLAYISVLNLHWFFGVYFGDLV